jgi:alkylated DNA repair dioxygenase AlkB
MRDWNMAVEGSLFEPELPAGLRYQPELISRADEAQLAADIAGVAFSDFEMRGTVARRRVAFFGESYGREAAAELPPFLIRLRARVAEWAGIDPDAFAMALINEYRPGTPIGWHRDAPQYDIVAGVSLLSSCRMKFRPYVSPGDLASRAGRPDARRRATHEIALEPRSSYLITGPSRTDYEHHIPPVNALRYSLTSRTLRQRGR